MDGGGFSRFGKCRLGLSNGSRVAGAGDYCRVS